jgi:hypothetical protein
VAFPLVNGTGVAHFRCGGVSDHALHHAIVAYRRAARAGVRGASEQAAPGGDDDGDDDGSVWVLVQWQCDLNKQVVNYGDGTYDVLEWLDNCEYWYTVLDGSGGGSSGPSLPLPPDPPPPPVSPDTACVSNADSPPIAPGATPGTPHGPLASLTIQQALFNLADQTANSNPPDELGGVILQRNDGEYSFMPVPSASPSPCSYTLPGRSPVHSPNDSSVVVAYVHTHPPENTPVYCPDLNPPNQAVAFGVSDSDWAAASYLQPYTDTNYMVDPTSIVRFGFDAESNRSQTVWSRPSKPNACAQL